MVLLSKCISHVLAWTPLIASLYTWLFFKYWSKPDYGLASIVLNDKVAPVMVGALISALCLLLSVLRDFFLGKKRVVLVRSCGSLVSNIFHYCGLFWLCILY